MQAIVTKQAMMSLELQTQPQTVTPTPIAFHVMRAPAQWNLATRVGFRFTFVYVVLYFFPFPLNHVPLIDHVAKWYDEGWTKILRWVGEYVLHLNHEMSFTSNGSGDTTAAYVQVRCFLILAMLATITWSVLDRRRANYETLHQWLRLYARLALGATLIGYGAIKVIQEQMPPPALFRLMEPYGESSPMGLLWTFIGASKAYSAFAGGAEMLGGLLLLVPGFTAIGALVAIAVMSNVFMLNMCYDVPVKLFSFHLLLMAMVLVAPDIRRLAELFFFHRRVELYAGSPLCRRKWLNRGLWGVQFAFCLFLTGSSLYAAHQGSKFVNKTVAPPLYGIWSVDEYAVDGKILPPLPTIEARWQRVIFDSPRRLMVEPMAGFGQRFLLHLDEQKQGFTLGKIDDEKWKADFTYQTPQPKVVTLTGQMDGHRINIRLHQVDTPKAFLLTGRGFHWINEYPFNQ